MEKGRRPFTGRMGRKMITRIASALAFGVVSLGLAVGAAAAEERQLNVYNWADYIGPDTIKDFEKETGIKVTYDNFDSYEVLDAKILTGSSGYDIVFPDNTLAYHHVKAGLYKALDKSKLPNFKNLDPFVLEQFRSADPNNDHVVPYMWWTNGVVFNPDQVKQRMPDAPTDSLSLVFDPKVVAKFQDCGVIFLDSPGDMFGLALRYIGKDPNSKDPADIQAAADMMSKVRPYIRRFDNVAQINALADGEACISVNWSGATMQAIARAQEAGSKVKLNYAVPKEGANIGFDGMAIPADAPHPAEALEFMNYMLRPDVIAKVTAYINYASANKESWSLLDESLRTNPVLFPDDAARKTLYPSIPRDEAGLAAMTRAWTRVKTGE
jgi:putrescine transport system substrate-binding protein